MKKNVVNKAWRGLKDAVPACLFVAGCLGSTEANAQLSSNPDKFLGNITTSYSVDYGNEKYYTLWNQITPENESKWASIEGNNDGWNWGGCDNATTMQKSTISLSNSTASSGVRSILDGLISSLRKSSMRR